MNNSSQYSALTSAESEERFRQIFFAHLEAEGFSDSDAFQLIFKTPAGFHGPPANENGLELLHAFRKHYRNQLPYSWYFEGLHQKAAPVEHAVEPPSRPVTFLVIPGIFGEFIDQLPFHSIANDQDSRFSRKWRPALEKIQDETFSLLDLDDVPRNLAQLVEIGSLDQGKHSFLNVVVLKAEAGSLETLGSLRSNVEVYRRRLEKLFAVIDEDADIFLVGYSRGLAVALDLVSAVHEDSTTGRLSPAEGAWFQRLRGVVGLGGVYYGAMFAQDVLSGEAGDTSKLFKSVCRTARSLQVLPDPASHQEKSKIVGHNIATWSGLVKQMLAAEHDVVARGRSFLEMDLEKVFANESKFRLLNWKLPKPDATGVLSLFNGFLRKNFKFTSTFAGHDKNIAALKILIGEVISGLETLTPEARDTWWRNHELPKELLLFSVTGTMPDTYLNDFYSPLLNFAGFGPKSTDFNGALRSSYYDATASENTQINDSQVSHFASRYWEQMYPEHRYQHYYLGVLGTHHWGMAFPYMIEDDHGNAFPRATLLKSISSFIASLES